MRKEKDASRINDETNACIYEFEINPCFAKLIRSTYRSVHHVVLAV